MLKPTNKPVSLGKESNFHSPSSTDLSVNSHTNPGSTEPNLASKMYMQLITVLGILIYLGLHCGFYADLCSMPVLFSGPKQVPWVYLLINIL